MNRRQRKKKNKQQEITVFIGCEMVARAEEYRKNERKHRVPA